jgi:putative transposase
MTVSDSSLRIGDEVTFRGVTYRLAGLDGDVALLAVAGESPAVIKVGALFADDSFKVTGSRPERRKIAGQSRLFDSLPPDIQQRARRMERHITEILDGLPCDAPLGQMPNPAYSVRFSLRQRELAKLSELQEQGEALSISSLQRLRLAYEKQGILGLVDQRLIRQTRITGQTDQRVVDTVLSVLEANTDQTSGTMA